MTAESHDTLRTGLARSLLREIADRLAQLADTGEAHAIDLRALPLSPADRTELHEVLGTGEVEAVLHVAGESTLRETAFTGVWWVTHRGEGGAIAAETIEICAAPEILYAQSADIGWSAARLAEELRGDRDAT
ncbi:hydrogenase expression/formation C-terminal domain-containing protein [Acidimangrovimonas sediminis]|uniref:hydrogenase expression/formation C-terminal domain-containing protein n=1 Tax=Acidimangrovimonas sediminis TaxID=2056283 RepID=UPI000C806771|nr:hydrogenase expression/formation C-terminal domain-containing protein [Acidimangrovimonas sediminis]